MTKYNVHVYKEMKLRFDNVEANSPAEAAEKVRFQLAENADSVDECEGDVLAALIDTVGDDEFKKSTIMTYMDKRYV